MNYGYKIKVFLNLQSNWIFVTKIHPNEIIECLHSLKKGKESGHYIILTSLNTDIWSIIAPVWSTIYNKSLTYESFLMI